MLVTIVKLVDLSVKYIVTRQLVLPIEACAVSKFNKANYAHLNINIQN